MGQAQGGLLGQGPGEERAQLSSELSSWQCTEQPRGWCRTGLPTPTAHISSLPFPLWPQKNLPSPPDPARAASLLLSASPNPSNASLTSQLRCHLPQEDSPDQSSPAGPTPSECPKHSAMALVTPLPWSLQWFGGSAAPLPPPLSPSRGRARHMVGPQQPDAGRRYEGSRWRAKAAAPVQAVSEDGSLCCSLTLSCQPGSSELIL